MASSGDALGQQYNTPEHAVGTNKSDVIIVGRGIVKFVVCRACSPIEPCRAQDPVAAAQEYQHAAWAAYEHRLSLSAN
jgi:orotidine-5'-phosphate decarboxylase